MIPRFHATLPAILLIFLCHLGTPSQAVPVPRDHVLLITIDDLNDWIGCLSESTEPGQDGRVTGEGHPQARTPNMDRLARRGVLFTSPHLPLFAPRKWFDAAPAKGDVVLAAARKGDLDDLPEISKRISSRVSYTHCARWAIEDEDNLRMLTQAYLACTTAMDDALGLVIDALDGSDMADNTWIVVLSDHGWHLGEKNHVAKQTLWTRSTRVPLIVVPPKRMEGTPRDVRCGRPVELLDVYPTLVAAAGLIPAASDLKLDGLSLLPWIEDPAARKDRPAITTIYAHNHSLCNTRYRYTRYADGSEELYDHQSDPHEFENLIEKARICDELKAVIEELSAWIPKNEPREPDLVDDRVKP